jgi:uncharacterized protein YdiU (UPF0061 family)
LNAPNENLVKMLFEVLEYTGNDFTNTFRILGNVKTSSESNKEIVEKLVEQSAPKSFFLKKCKHPYADNPKVLAVLNSKPEILKYYGIDPDQLK